MCHNVDKPAGHYTETQKDKYCIITLTLWILSQTHKQKAERWVMLGPWVDIFVMKSKLGATQKE